MAVTAEEVAARLRSVAEEIEDDEGRVIGYVANPARFKLAKPYLGGGGFLEVILDEASGDFVANEWDALWDPKAERHYPAGHCFPTVWRAVSLEEAVQRILDHLN